MLDEQERDDLEELNEGDDDIAILGDEDEELEAPPATTPEADEETSQLLRDSAWATRTRYSDEEREAVRRDIVKLRRRLDQATKRIAELRPYEAKAQALDREAKLAIAMAAAGVPEDVGPRRARAFLNTHGGEMPESAQHLVNWLRKFDLIP
jgi:hypothetical protein